MSEQHDLLSARLSRRTLLKAAVAAGATAASPTLWMQPVAASASSLASSHVGFGADAQREATVSFATPSSFRRAVIDYGPDDGLGARVEADIRGVAGVHTRYGQAILTGLEPGRTYRYRVRLDGVSTATGIVSTAPSATTPFSFTAFGDQGVSADARLIFEQIAKVKPSFNLVAGDLCYADTTGTGGHHDVFDPSVWDRWIRMIEPVAQSSPWMCATGNHDMEPGYGPLGYTGYLSRFLLPSNGASHCPSTYAFRYGNVGVVSLDSNDLSYEFPHNLDYSRGRQTAWLDAQLTSFRGVNSDVDFIVAFFHHCVYSTNTIHGSESLIREQWVPLFDKHQVDLVVNGHAHMYERSRPLRAGRVTAHARRGTTVDSRLGTTYITAGGGGASVVGGFLKQHAIVVDKGGARHRELAPWSVPTKSINHSFLAIDVTPAAPGRPATMAVRAVSKRGTPLDEVTLTRSNVASTPSADPPLWAVGAGGGVAGVAALTAGAAWWRHREDNHPEPPPGDGGITEPVGPPSAN